MDKIEWECYSPLMCPNPNLKAPWSVEQVEALNAYQKLGYVHEFTCPNGWPLTATPEGWTCPGTCGYTQDWCHDWMADKAKHPQSTDARQ